jgi:predicted nucleotidyltransferase
MDGKSQVEIKKRYMAAVDSFVSKVRDDQNVIAVIVCGSVAYDDVWEKSDIDMTLIVRDQHLNNDSYCIIEDGITINVMVVARSEFKRFIEKQIGGTFLQSYYSKGRIVYTSDDSLYEYFEDIRKPGSDDIELSILYSACELVSLYEKCQKWLMVKGDPLYAQYYLLKAAEPLARIEIYLRGEVPTRECIRRAVEIDSEMIGTYYNNAMSRRLREEEIASAIEGIDRYLEQHIDIIKKPVIDFMADQEIKTVTLIVKHFHAESHFIVGIFDYLAEKGVIEKVSQTIRITPKSRMAVEEIGFLYIPDMYV